MPAPLKNRAPKNPITYPSSKHNMIMYFPFLFLFVCLYVWVCAWWVCGGYQATLGQCLITNYFSYTLLLLVLSSRVFFNISNYPCRVRESTWITKRNSDSLLLYHTRHSFQVNPMWHSGVFSLLCSNENTRDYSKRLRHICYWEGYINVISLENGIRHFATTLYIFCPFLGSLLLASLQNERTPCYILPKGHKTVIFRSIEFWLADDKKASDWLVKALVDLGVWLQPKTIQNPFIDRSRRRLLRLSAFISAGEGRSPRDDGFGTLFYVHNMVCLPRTCSDNKCGFWRWL